MSPTPTPTPTPEPDPDSDENVDAGPAGISAIAGFRGDVSAAMNLVGKRVRAGDRVVIVTAGHGPAARLAEQLADRDVPARMVGALDSEPRARVATVVTGPLQFGVDAPLVGLLVLTETDLLGSQGGLPALRRRCRRDVKGRSTRCNCRPAITSFTSNTVWGSSLS